MVQIVLHLAGGEDLLSVLGEEEDLNTQDLTQQDWLVVDFSLDLILKRRQKLCQLLLLLVRLSLGLHLDDVSDGDGRGHQELTRPIDVDFLRFALFVRNDGACLWFGLYVRVTKGHWLPWVTKEEKKVKEEVCDLRLLDLGFVGDIILQVGE